MLTACNVNSATFAAAQADVRPTETIPSFKSHFLLLPNADGSQYSQIAKQPSATNSCPLYSLCSLPSLFKESCSPSCESRLPLYSSYTERCCPTGALQNLMCSPSRAQLPAICGDVSPGVPRYILLKPPQIHFYCRRSRKVNIWYVG